MDGWLSGVGRRLIFSRRFRGMARNSQRGFRQALDAFHHPLQGTAGSGLGVQEFLVSFSRFGLKRLHRFESCGDGLEGIGHMRR